VKKKNPSKNAAQLVYQVGQLKDPSFLEIRERKKDCFEKIQDCPKKKKALDQGRGSG